MKQWMLDNPDATKHITRAALLDLIARIASTEALTARVAELEGALRTMRTEAVLLLNHAEGCAVNHYGNDVELHGMPGWLSDSRARIKDASEAIDPATIIGAKHGKS